MVSRPAHPPAISETAGTKPLPDPKPPRKTDPRLVPLKLASNAEQRQKAASRHPELRPPHALLSHRENQALELAFWQGLVYKEVGERLGISTARATQLSNRALRKLDAHLSSNGEPRHKSTLPGAKVDDPRITALRTAGPVTARREVAQRYPELRPPHRCLSELQNDLLELSFWQARTYGEIASLKSLSRRQVSTGVRHALETLNRHLCSDPHQDEDHLEAVLLALNACGSVRRAAKKLEVGEEVLKAFMDREGIRARTVFEVGTGEQHH